MATHGTSFSSIEAERSQRSGNSPAADPPAFSRTQNSRGIHLAYRSPDVRPVEFLETPRPASGMRRLISREQGCALETIGHAVDYLNDSYLNDGPEDEILSFCAPGIEATRILVAAQCQMLAAMPLVKPLRARIWNSLCELLRRPRASSVLPLSSSR